MTSNSSDLKSFNRRRMLKLGTIGAAGLLGAMCQARHSRAASTARRLTGQLDGAAYRIQVPAKWNGILVLYSHGTILPGLPNAAMEVSDPVTGAALLAQGYALAGSSYRTTGWAVADAFTDQLALLDFFARQVGKPERTIAWGDSQGGLISAGLIQTAPEQFAGALPMCGPLMGVVASFNGFFDIQYAFKALLAPHDASLHLVHVAQGIDVFTDPDSDFRRALTIYKTAQQSAAGRARLALANALYPIADAHHAPPTPPVPAGLAARARYEIAEFAGSALGFLFALRPDLEARAGGNPTFNTGVRYVDIFAQAIQRDRVTALYKQASLNLDTDLATLDAAPRIAADAKAIDYLRKYIVFDGKLARPVLTLHSIGDTLVSVAAESAYANVVAAAGSSAMLRQLYVDRVGHVVYTPAERLVAFAQLLQRIETGKWNDEALIPASLNTAATKLGRTANMLAIPGAKSGTPGVAAPPVFAAYQPPPYPRPFDTRTPNPTAAATPA